MATSWLLMRVMLILLYDSLFAKGSETQRPTLTATEISKDQTITMTCNIHEGTARSVGWYRNQGRKVISIGYVNDSCETSPPELPFSAECLCLNITVYTCTLTGQEMCTVEVNKGAVVIKVSSNITKDILNIDVDRDYVGYCDKSFEQAVILLEYKTQYNISLTQSGQCIFTILNYNLTQVTVNISSQAKALTAVLNNGKSHQRCKDPWMRSFNLKKKALKSSDSGLTTGAFVGIGICALIVVATLVVAWRKRGAI